MKPTNSSLCLCTHYEVSHLLLPTSLNTYTEIDACCSSKAQERSKQEPCKNGSPKKNKLWVNSPLRQKSFTALYLHVCMPLSPGVT